MSSKLRARCMMRRRCKRATLSPWTQASRQTGRSLSPPSDITTRKGAAGTAACAGKGLVGGYVQLCAARCRCSSCCKSSNASGVLWRSSGCRRCVRSRDACARCARIGHGSTSKSR
eukprot:1228546-Pyramimonas_sp.AAC.1